MSRPGPALVVLALAGLLSACAGSPQALGPDRPAGGNDPGPRDELGARDGRVCPRFLPSDDAERFGTHEPATASPSEPSAARAWVCGYGLTSAGPRDREVPERWRRQGGVTEVTSGLADLAAGVGDLRPAGADRGCPADLGPRWLLVLADGDGDLTGAVLDDFGCDVVRMTDDPFLALPGEAEGRGVVRGALESPGDLVLTVAALHGAGAAWSGRHDRPLSVGPAGPGGTTCRTATLPPERVGHVVAEPRYPG